MAAKKDAQTSIRLSTELRDKLRVLADKDDRTLGFYIVKVLQSHVERKTKSRAAK